MSDTYQLPKTSLFNNLRVYNDNFIEWFKEHYEQLPESQITKAVLTKLNAEIKRRK